MNSAQAAQAQRANFIWPAAIVGLLAMNVAIVGITVYFAHSDPSAAVEPNYYEKAVKWDQTAAQRDASTRLGWTAALAVQAQSAGSSSLSVRLADAAGNPVSGAQIELVAFHNARAADRRKVLTEEVGAGEYRGVAPIDRDGKWHFQVVARRGAETFVSEFDQDIAVTGGAR